MGKTPKTEVQVDTVHNLPATAGRVRKPRTSVRAFEVPDSLRDTVSHANRNPRSQVVRITGLRSASVMAPISVLRAARRTLESWHQENDRLSGKEFQLELGQYKATLKPVVMLCHNDPLHMPVYVDVSTLAALASLE
jgi:hypothetical protein